MSRIRSVHPGLWTDEEFVSLTLPARLFLIGLWNEADDYGLFEWKPMRLKMRLAPADAIDAEALMKELAGSGFLVRIERGGKALGVVKNFRKFQRPKNPSSPLVPVDVEIKAIISLSDGDSPTPALPQPYPSPGEIRPQMEDVGDKRGEKKKEPSSKEDDAPKNEQPSLPAVDPADLSDEEEFWQILVPKIEAAGIARSRAVQVGKLAGDFQRSAQILRDVLKAKNPDSYLGGVVKRLREETAIEDNVVVPIKPKKGEPNPPPEWVQDVRALGSRVEWLEPGRWLDCDGDIVDDRRSVLSG